MADDIKIGGTNAPQQGGANLSGHQPAASAGDQLNPVIDLRNAGGVPAGAAPASAVAQPAAAPIAPPAAPTASPSRKNAIMLGEEETGQAAPQDKYAIPTLVKDKFPDLIQLIKETESMNDEERDYWFQILPIMTEEQIKKFRDILVNEKEQLAGLDKEYEQELNKLNEKHMIEWKEFETREKRKSLSTAEQASQQQEQTQEEDLLKRLSQI